MVNVQVVQVQPLIQAKWAIVYLDVANDVPRLAMALRQLGLKSCGYQGSNHDKPSRQADVM